MSVHVSTQVIVNRILLVEDDRDEADFLKTFLEKKGFTVELTRDFGQARSAFTMFPPDFVILDAILPNNVSGFEICDWVKKQTDGLAVLMLTAIDMDDARDLASRCGADGYMTKPYDPDHLVQQIHQLADTAWARKHLERETPAHAEKVRFACPGCGKHLRVKPEHRGRTVTCPKCAEPVPIP